MEINVEQANVKKISRKSFPILIKINKNYWRMWNIPAIWAA
jgi:hypothetical protein